jgi:hypothetical protein
MDWGLFIVGPGRFVNENHAPPGIIQTLWHINSSTS